jgi:hypothetical protein
MSWLFGRKTTVEEKKKAPEYTPPKVNLPQKTEEKQPEQPPQHVAQTSYQKPPVEEVHQYTMFLTM